MLSKLHTNGWSISRTIPYAWGGVHSERATELIGQLMPASEPIRIRDHNHGELIGDLIFELCLQNDPRAAETLIAMTCGYRDWDGEYR